MTVISIATTSRNILYIILFSCGLTSPLGAISRQDVQQVLDNLVKTIGDRHFIKPRIEISDDEKTVAAFYGRKNLIVVEKKALSVCQSMGKDSLHALAFLLGHELMHARNGHSNECRVTSNYLAWASDAGQEKIQEHNADIGGVFLAYLAGYRTVVIVPEIIRKIYISYGLEDKTLQKYPGLAERKKTADFVLKKIEKLILLFDAGNFLTATGRHEEAIAVYKQILPYYNGVEIMNNTGLNYLLNALDATSVNHIRWAIPIELDSKTRLNKPMVSRDDSGQEIQEKTTQRKWLLDAKRIFEDVLQMDHDYYPAITNLLITNILLGDTERVLKEINTSVMPRVTLLQRGSQRDIDIALLVKAFALAESGKEKEAISIWKELSSSSFEAIQWQAKYNQNAVRNTATMQATGNECEYIPEIFKGHIDGIRLHASTKAAPAEFTDPDISCSVSIEHTLQSTLVTFSKGKKKRVILQFINNLHQRSDFDWREIRRPENGFITNEGVILHCPEKKVALKLNDASNWITQGIKYHIFN